MALVHLKWLWMLFLLLNSSHFWFVIPAARFDNRYFFNLDMAKNASFKFNSGGFTNWTAGQRK